jgi:malyl-CoA/(S)-citramalyl-CoA lyase
VQTHVISESRWRSAHRVHRRRSRSGVTNDPHHGFLQRTDDRQGPRVRPTVDILLGNLEDAVPPDPRRTARKGLVRVGREFDLGQTRLWTRINSLESPWMLEDLTTLVSEIGDRLEVVMVPKVEGVRDIHYIDRLLAQLEARVGLTRPILVHALLETSLGMVTIEEIAMASPRLQGSR